MIAKRIIPCLDVKDNQVVKGVQFQNHTVIGDILTLARTYVSQYADELVFYDITASSEDRPLSKEWISLVAKELDIPFCVAGGIRTLAQAEKILNAGADKISLNSPALENPDLIDELVAEFGSQCIVIGIDSLAIDQEYRVCQYTGSVEKTKVLTRKTQDWVKEVQARGAGEIVLNCMDQDGMRQGYAVEKLKKLRELIHVPLIASGGAGTQDHFLEVFTQANVDGALAASVFHQGLIGIADLKKYLAQNGVKVRS